MVGLVLSPERRLLASKWFWIAAAIAFVIAMPNVVWQYIHHFPTLEDLRLVKATHKNVELPPIPFLIQQLMMLNPTMALVWVPGLAFFFVNREGRRYRFLGFTYLAFLAILMAHWIGVIPFLGPLFDDSSGQGDIHLIVNTRVFLTSFLTFIVIGLLSGTWPAIKASRLDPVEALRPE